MSDQCECEKFDVIFEDLTAEELGPAYAAYKSGVNIPKKWEPDKVLSPTFMGDCCASRPYNFYDDVLWPEHLTMLIIWHTLAVIFIALWYRRQSYQPLRFRGFREMLLMWFTMSFMFTYQVLSSCGGFTTNCISMLFAFEVFLPAHMMFYISKGIQFSYIYTWNAAKSSASNVETIKWFYNHKWILSFRTLVTSMIIAGMIGFLSTLTRLADPFYSEDGINFYSTFRCKWWQIPEEYTYAKSPNDGRCSCLAASQIDSEEDALGYLAELYPCMLPLYGSSVTTAYPIFAVPNTTSSCSIIEEKIENGTALTVLDSSYQLWCDECQIDLAEPGCNACFSSAAVNLNCQGCLNNLTATADGDTPNDDGSTTTSECLLCGISLSNDNCQECLGQISQPACSHYLREFFIHGDDIVGTQSCGFFDETPHSSTCKFCLTADRDHLVGWAFYIFSFAFIMLTIGILCARMRDQLGLNKEIIINAVNIIMVVSIVISGMLSEKVHEGYINTWDTYSLIYFFVYFMLWVNMLTSIIIPVVMCYYYLYRDLRNAAVSAVLKHADEERKSLMQLSESGDGAKELSPVARTIANGGFKGFLLAVYLVLTSSGVYNAQDIVTVLGEKGTGWSTVWTPESKYSRVSAGMSSKNEDTGSVDSEEKAKTKAVLRFQRSPRKAGKTPPPAEVQMEKLEYCFVNSQCLELYEKFSREEFTVENVKFLCASYTIESLVDEFEKLDISDTGRREAKVNQIQNAMMDLYSNFIRVDSPMEVNLPSKVRCDLESKMKARSIRAGHGSHKVEEKQDANSQTGQLPITGQGLVSRVIRQSVTVFSMRSTTANPLVKQDEPDIDPNDSFTAIQSISQNPRLVVEIKQLILRDSWSRFELTSLHKEFDAVFKSTSALDEKLGDLYVGDHGRTDSDPKSMELIRKTSSDTKKKKDSAASPVAGSFLGASSLASSSLSRSSLPLSGLPLVDEDEDIH